MSDLPKQGWLARLRASIAPLVAGGIAGLVIIMVPVILTELMALRSNRPEFSFIEAGRGSLHWTHLLSLAFPDLFGAMDESHRDHIYELLGVLKSSASRAAGISGA